MRRLSLVMALPCVVGLACEDARPLSVTLTPGLSLDPPGELDFGPLPGDAVARRVLRLGSVGTGPLTVRALEVSGPDAARWALELEADLPALVFPGEVLEIGLELRACPELDTPGADRCACPGGARAATLSVDTDATEAPVTLALRAEAIPLGPRIGASPPAQLDLRPGLTSTLTIVNTGCGPLRLSSARLTGPGGAAPYGGAADIQLEGCEAWPCPLDLDVCPPDAAICPTARQLRLRYDNHDAIGAELAELRLGSDDARQPERVLLVRAAEGAVCRPPDLGLHLHTEAPCPYAPVRVEARTHPAEAVAWRWLFAPRPIPALDVEGAIATFTPEASGTYVLEASAEGCRPEARASISLTVEGRCH